MELCRCADVHDAGMSGLDKLKQQKTEDQVLCSNRRAMRDAEAKGAGARLDTLESVQNRAG